MLSARLNTIEVHLDLYKNRYTALQISPQPVEFDKRPVTLRDYLGSTIDGSEDVLLFPSFVASSARGFFHRRKPINKIIKVAAHCANKMSKAEETPQETISAMISTYNRMKTFRVSRLSCIPDSLACLFFLKDEGCRANFVIGVRENPFMAHAWLTINGAVANDSIANIFHYTPIFQTIKTE